MSFLAHWKCDEIGGVAVTTVVDSSGHGNNHDFSNVNYWQSSGFFNKRYRSQFSAEITTVGTPADFRVTGDLTVMAWVIPLAEADTDEIIIGCANGVGELQADNLLWALAYDRANSRFGMRWEQGAGVDVDAWGPSGSMHEGEPSPIHICCIRDVSVQADVKFVKDGVDLAADVTGLTAPDGGGSSLVEIGRYPVANALFYDGYVWNIRVYDEALTVPAVLAIRDAELAEAQRGAVLTGSELDTAIYPKAGWSDDLA